MIKTTFVLLLYLFLTIFSFYAPVSIKGILALLFMLIPLLVSYKTYVNNKKLLLYICFFLFVFYSMRLLNFRFSLAGFYLVSNIILAMHIYKSKFNLKLVKLSYALISSFYIFLACSGLPLDSFFIGTSRNLISVILLVFVGVIYILEYKVKESYSFWPLLPLIAISILAVGRGGIICSVLLLLCYFFSKLNNRKRIFLFVCAVSVMTIFLWENIVTLYDNLFAKTRFAAEGLASDERDILFSIYMDNINLKTFFIGYDYYTDSFYRSLDYNAHNSYIRLHHFLGIFSLPIVFLLILSLFKLFKRDFFLCSLFLVLLLRGYVDNIYFFDKYDFILYTLVLIGLKDSTYENTIPAQI